MRRIVFVTLLCFQTMLSAQAQTTLPTFWNFSTPGIASPPTGWIPGLGTNGNLTYSGGSNSVGGDNTACRLDATGEYLTIWFADKPGPLSYWIKGTGISPAPAFTGIFNVEESADGNSWNTLRSFTTASPLSGTMTRYVETPATATRFIRFFYTEKLSGSNIALDSVVLQAAPAATTPTMVLKQGTERLVQEAVSVVGNSSSVNYTIENKGTVDALSITGFTITGNDASDFTINNMPTTIPANGSAGFTLQFTPSQTGSHHAVLSIANNDAEKNPYLIYLYGIGGNYASEPTAQPANIQFTGVTSYGFKLLFNHPNPKPESYLILRKKGSPVTEAPADGQTYKRGDYIGNAQVAGIGTDTTYIPTYIFANTDYYFSVFAMNGPASYENYRTSSPLSGSVTTSGKATGSYYSGINSTQNNFVTQLSQKTNPHDTVFYSQYIGRFVNPFLTRDTAGGKKTLSCVYTNMQYVYEEPFLWWTGTNSGTQTREHTFPQSWMPSNTGGTWPNEPVSGKELPEYNDLHNLFPADQANANGKRSNHPYGIVVNPTFTSPTGLGKLGTDANGNTVYEPRDEHKGDAARALFYMATAYHGIGGRNWSIPSQQNIALLKQWHFNDLPDAWEIARHEFIYSLQGNRNPFVDSVNFVCRIDFSNMTWIANPSGCGITERTLQLTSPVGGEVIAPGSNGDYIKWTATNLDSVRIELLIEDTLYGVIESSVAAAAGNYSWTTPPALTSSKAKIRLVNTTYQLESKSPAYFMLSSSIGLNKVKEQFTAAVYPNPSNGKLTIDAKDIADVKIKDIMGRTISEEYMQVSPDQVSIQLTQTGMFFIHIRNKKGDMLVKTHIVN